GAELGGSSCEENFILRERRELKGGSAMKAKIPRPKVTRLLIALTCAIVLAPGNAILFARQTQQPAAQETAVKIPADQLDSLVAPIALYPDNLLSQTLVASTY